MIHKSLLIENFFKFAFLFFYISIRFFVLCCRKGTHFLLKKRTVPFVYIKIFYASASRHCSISHLGVLVAPQMPTVWMSFSQSDSISSGPSMR